MRPRVWSRRQPRFGPGWIVPLLAVATLMAMTVGWFDIASRPLAGLARAVDGDTLSVGTQRIRLLGLDAPELQQSCVDTGGIAWACGSRARAFLADLLKRGAVVCAHSGYDAYRRVLASCRIDGDDIGAQIVAAGWAVGDFGYIAEQGAARAARLGIWSGSFLAPAEWRRTHGATPGIWEWIRSWFQ